MKPVPNALPWFTTDLTCGYAHKITAVSGTVRYILMFPKTWEKSGEPMMVTLLDGTTRSIQNYRVLSWEEVELVPAAVTESAANTVTKP